MEINYGETSVFPAQMMKNDTKFFAIFNWLIHLVHLFCVISLFPMIQILWIRKPKRRVYLWCVLMSFGMQRYGRSLVATLLALSCSESDRHERSPRIYRENQEYPATEEESRLKDTEIHKGNNLLKRTKFSCDCRWNDLHTTTPFTVQHNIPRFDFFLSLDFSCFFSFSFTIHMITQINSARVFFSFFLSSYFPIRFSLVLLYLLCSAAMVWIISWSKHKTKTNALNEFMLSTFL